MNNLISILLILLGLYFFFWLGLQIKPKPFSPFASGQNDFETVPLPDGLPAPVERFYKKVYGSRVPLIESAVIYGRAVIRPALNIPLPARFIFVHKTGRDYRHYIEATFFGFPIFKVDEGYLDGRSFFESPMGKAYNEEKTNQGANLAIWAEAGWFPALWITDPRVHWQDLDQYTALLFVPYGNNEENFVVRFNPETAMIDTLEAMRYRTADEAAQKILWITSNLPGETLEKTGISSIGAATWLDQGKPWAVFHLEKMILNSDVNQYIRKKGK